MTTRLTKIDALTRPDHWHLREEDECFYAGEYTARQGYKFSETNHLIINLKKPMDRRGTPQWKYKGEAIKAAARLLRSLLPQELLTTSLLVPTPPSKAKDDPMYDDRIMQMLQLVGSGLDANICELVRQKASMDAAHDRDDRPTLQQLEENYVLDDSALAQDPQSIAVFDDLITTGAHFVAMKNVIAARYPQANMIGIFLARRALGSTIDDFLVTE